MAKSHTTPKIAAGIKTRRHHNNAGTRQVRTGKTASQLQAMCQRLGLPFRNGKPARPIDLRPGKP